MKTLRLDHEVDHPLVLGDAYYYGMSLLDTVTKDMCDGKPICCIEDAGLLAQIICNTKGDHLEIGTAYGGSALIAIKAMDYCGRKDKVVCIDPFKEGRRKTAHKAVEMEFWNNIDKFGVRDRIEHIIEFSHPFPIKGRRFETALIDGDHSYEYVLNDWENVKKVVDKYVMFHDFRKSGVNKTVNEHALQDKRWSLSTLHGWSAVLIKC